MPLLSEIQMGCGESIFCFEIQIWNNFWGFLVGKLLAGNEIMMTLV